MASLCTATMHDDIPGVCIATMMGKFFIDAIQFSSLITFHDLFSSYQYVKTRKFMSIFQGICNSFGHRKSGTTEKKPAPQVAYKIPRAQSSAQDHGLNQSVHPGSRLGVEDNGDDEQHNLTFSSDSKLDISSFTTVWRSCEELHGVLCNPQHISPPDSFRVVDIDQQCVVPVDHFVRYVALSYVWGTPGAKKDQPLRLTKENCSILQQKFALSTENLPKTIADTISFCRLIGERYLWIDRLCIVQDDASSKHQQIQEMASIFQNAALTIIAANGKDTSSGLPSLQPQKGSNSPTVRNTFHVDVGKSIWNERAWTFQEYVLSKKCVFFTPDKVYFQCRESFWCGSSSFRRAGGEVDHLLSTN